jgi:hypothetical protein
MAARSGEVLEDNGEVDLREPMVAGGDDDEGGL